MNVENSEKYNFLENSVVMAPFHPLSLRGLDQTFVSMLQCAYGLRVSLWVCWARNETRCNMPWAHMLYESPQSRSIVCQSNGLSLTDEAGKLPAIRNTIK